MNLIILVLCMSVAGPTVVLCIREAVETSFLGTHSDVSLEDEHTDGVDFVFRGVKVGADGRLAAIEEECASAKELETCVDELEKCDEEVDDIEELKLENQELAKEIEKLTQQVNQVGSKYISHLQ